MSLSLITALIVLFIFLIMVPLVISRKAENNSKILNEWDKIKEYGKKINDKTRNNKISNISFLIINDPPKNASGIEPIKKGINNFKL